MCRVSRTRPARAPVASARPLHAACRPRPGLASGGCDRVSVGSPVRPVDATKEEIMRPGLLALALVLALGGPAAAADGPVLPLPAEDQQTISQLLGPNVVGKALPSQPIGDAALYFPLVERT